MPKPEDRSDPHSILARVSVFSGLKRKQLNALIEASKERSYKEGAVVVEAGSLGVGFYMVMEGKLEVRKKGDVIARLGKGDFFGEMALLSNSPRIADVVAVAPTKCLVLSVWSFTGLVKTDPEIALAVTRTMAKRLSENEATASG